MDPNKQELSTQSIPPVTSNQHSNFLHMIAIGVIMLFVGLIGGYFLASNKVRLNSNNSQQSINNIIQTTPTVISQISPIVTQGIPNWNTYENKQLGISFQYPKDWITANPFGSPSSLDFIGLIPTNKTQGSSITPIFVEYWNNPKNLSLQDFETQQDANKAMPLNLYSSQAQTTSVAGFPAYTQQKSGCEPYLCEKVVVLEKNNIFVFYNVHIGLPQYSEQDLSSYEGIFSQILSTVKFTN